MANKVERFEFRKVYPGSEIAAVLGIAPDDPIWARCSIYVCEGWDCPNCGRKSIYFQPINKAIDLLHRDNAAMLEYITGRAMAHPYHCLNCDTRWADLTVWWQTQGRAVPNPVPVSC